MTVFVITKAYDYEGESPVAVASSLAFAKKLAEQEAAVFGYESSTWREVNGHLELDCGSTQWVVREETVQGTCE